MQNVKPESTADPSANSASRKKKDKAIQTLEANMVEHYSLMCNPLPDQEFITERVTKNKHQNWNQKPNFS